MGLDALDYPSGKVQPGIAFISDDVYKCIHSGCEKYDCTFNFRTASKHMHVTHIQDHSAKDASYRIPIEWRFDLIPPLVLRELAAIYEEGARKYGPSKYIEKPLPFSVLLNHLTNHLNLYCSGDRSEKHLAKVLWGVATMMTLVDMIDKGLVERSISDLSLYGSGATEALQKRLASSNESSV